ncbi:MAG: LysM peptidoglycan-binding domain-containing protein [Oligoflexia bacterium]|nr:LysM peptidoglycan-binding domain-containing protein [Oligoflexia bacterium]
MGTAATTAVGRTEALADLHSLEGTTSGMPSSPTADRGANPNAITAGQVAAPALEKKAASPSSPDPALSKQEARLARDLFYNNHFDSRLKERSALPAEAQVRVNAEYKRLEAADPERRLEHCKGATYDQRQREYYQVSLRDQAVSALRYELLTPGHRPDDDRVRFHLTAKHSPHDIAVPEDFRAATGQDLYATLRGHKERYLGGMHRDEYEQLQIRTGRPDVAYLAHEFRGAEANLRYASRTAQTGTHRMGELLELLHDSSQLAAFEQALQAEYQAHGEKKLADGGIAQLAGNLPQRERAALIARVDLLKQSAPASAPLAERPDEGGATEETEPEDAPAGTTTERVPLKHRVAEGDRVAKLAKQYGVSVEAICEANGIELERGVMRGGRKMDFALIRPGQELVIPGQFATTEQLADQGAAPETAPQADLAAATFSAVQLSSQEAIQALGQEVAAVAKIGDYLLTERVNASVEPRYFVARAEELDEISAGVYKFKPFALAQR